MSTAELDDVDRGILHMLQRNARETTAAEMADAVGVSPSTVRNRIERLEATGVIEGYVPRVNYERANYQHFMVLICHAPVGRRAEVADAVMEIEGIVGVREMLTGTANVHIEAVGTDSDEADRITAQLTELDLEIRSVDLVKRARIQPFNHFGSHLVEE
ncbi:Lrp/AsnC family transcriptional regulator [Natrarchaeobaculum aegyptiacum]|uniref:Transcriptional regulator n=1 Tax=Natrarchaeobaculum aegyptiacum TaxID=745377 RepID=A0A2Z2HWQ4_9EURY|nr:Lrp/AsnC family transcriptional regulator [Natrarchaeobaculum aegyptiacum]ARS89384.1 transcriptional regulator [Natrarchaeobaculum aegyptiacum]